jgi:flavin reductase (DIM6/NTAB) family NADH-FMN oxidoreductase RutF
MDKITECGTRTAPASKIDCVLFADAVANFECELESELETGDHVIFVGRIVASHMNEDPNVKRLYTLAEGYKMGGAGPREG